MALVSLTINNRSYQINCDDGQEEHLARLAAYVDERMTGLVSAMGQVGDNKLLVMTALLVVDELFDAYHDIERLGGGGGDGQAKMAEQLGKIAQRIETIAARDTSE